MPGFLAGTYPLTVGKQRCKLIIDEIHYKRSTG